VRELDSTRTDLQQLSLLASLKAYDAALGECQGLLRDVRLQRYAAVRPPAPEAASDLLIPVADRLEALRSETERLIAQWRKREGALSQVASDVRRALDTQVTLSDTLTASFATAAAPDIPPETTLGLAVVAAWGPCSVTESCIRIVPAANLSFQLSGLLSAELGLTLASTDAPGRTRHLFWFVSGLTGVSMRLGKARAQRIGLGALILRQSEGSNFDTFKLGGYASFTLYDLRL
jgi:hypothetical protein